HQSPRSTLFPYTTLFRSSQKLVRWCEESLDEGMNEGEMLAFNGPYRVVLEYIQSRDLGDSQLQSATGYYISQWSKDVYSIFEKRDRKSTRLNSSHLGISY